MKRIIVRDGLTVPFCVKNLREDGFFSGFGIDVRFHVCYTLAG